MSDGATEAVTGLSARAARTPFENSDAERFTAYGASHWGALLVIAVGALLLVEVGRWLRERDPRDRLGRTMAVAGLGFTVPLQVLYFTPEHWNAERTLPLQLCDIASVVAVYALWSHCRWAVALTYALTYYWGLTLTPQAVLTPDLATPFPEPFFFLYWGMHMILDLLGPWPWYILAEVVIIAAAWALVTWPGPPRGRTRACRRVPAQTPDRSPRTRNKETACASRTHRTQLAALVSA
jgi:uncharacterized membrane protein YwaF